jgi:CheY-like chemotaxis protein
MAMTHRNSATFPLVTTVRRKLLVIDDSEVILSLTATVLDKAGYEVRTSTVVRDLRTMFGAWRPDVILTDVNMPGMSGLELCRKLKSLYETADVPVLLFSGLPEDELAALALDCEADGYVIKSEKLADLPVALAAVLDKTLF